MGWTSIYQLFWCSPGVQGFDTLPVPPEKEKKPMNCRQQRRSTAALRGVEKSRPLWHQFPLQALTLKEIRVFFQSCFHRILMVCSATRWDVLFRTLTVFKGLVHSCSTQMVDFCSKQQQGRMIQCREMLNMGLNKKKSRKNSQHPMVFLKYFILNFHMNLLVKTLYGILRRWRCCSWS